MKSLLAATALGVSLLVAGNADASLMFEIDGANSSVSVTKIGGTGGVTGHLVSGLGGTNFTLNEGDSSTFDFFSLSGKGWAGVGAYQVSATLAFSQPTGTPSAGGSGVGLYAHFLGVLNSGTLTWLDMPEYITLADNSVIQVDFQDGWTVKFGKPVVSATVRLVDEATKVPEPATLGLLGVGMAGMGFAFRRRQANDAETSQAA